MNKVIVPSDELLYSSVLDREPEWLAVSARAPVPRRRSRIPVVTAVVLAGAAFVSGLAVGSGLVLGFFTGAQPRPRRPPVWMFPSPAIAFPDADSVDPATGPIGSPAESTRDRKREPESRLRGESR